MDWNKLVVSKAMQLICTRKLVTMYSKDDSTKKYKLAPEQ